jgi:hypothetical protein
MTHEAIIRPNIYHLFVLICFSGESFLRFEDYSTFWVSICSNKDACSRYVARIINLLMNYEADPIKMEREFSKACSLNIDYFITNLLNTVHFLDMLGGIDVENSAFVSSIVKYEITKRNNKRFKFKRVDDALHELSRRRLSQGHAIVKMIIDCSSLESDDEMVRSMSKAATILMFLDDNGQDNIIDMTRMEFPFTFQGLCKRARDEQADQIFNELLRQLNGSAGSTVSALPHMQGRTLALLLMLKELLTQFPCSDDYWLQRASSIVSSFYKWPRPYGTFAKKIIEFLNVERRSPGNKTH